jgi:hypothetical protein
MRKAFRNPWDRGGNLHTDWVEEFNSTILNNEKAGSFGCSTGEIILSGFKKENFREIQIIPEDGQPYQPNNNGSFYGDGFYYQDFSDSNYWYKVSGGSSVNVRHSGTTIFTTAVISKFCERVAKIAGKYYKVGWEPKTKKHYTENPFDK